MSGEFAGRLGERVTLSRPVPDRDRLGGWTGGWRVSGEAWAQVAPVGQEPRAEPLLWQVTLRPTALFAGDRIGWGADTLRVRTVRIDPAASDRMIALAEQER